MTSSKIMSSSTKTRKSDLSRRSSSSSTKFLPILTTNTAPATIGSIPTDFGSGDLDLASMTVDGMVHNVYDTNPSTESTLLDAQITLIDTPKVATSSIDGGNIMNGQPTSEAVDDMWREIVSGDNSSSRSNRELKEEAPDEMMTLEDFLAKAAAVDDDEIKMSGPGTERLSGGVFNFDPIPPSPFHALDKVEGSIIGYGNGIEMIAGSVSSGGGSSGAGGGRGKRGRQAMEPLDKAAQQRQKRMIKNRESAARSRERKQAYQLELESLAVRLEEENEQLLKEKTEKTKGRYKQLMENVIPVVEKRRPPPFLRRVRSMHW